MAAGVFQAQGDAFATGQTVDTGPARKATRLGGPAADLEESNPLPMFAQHQQATQVGVEEFPGGIYNLLEQWLQIKLACQCLAELDEP